MAAQFFRIGDKVVFKIRTANRAWTKTYDNVPDGTVGTVCGVLDIITYTPRVPFLGKRPGAYHEKGAVSVWLRDGRIIPGDYVIDLVDQNVRKKRLKTYSRNDTSRRIGDLPETRFWEQDKVYVNFPDQKEKKEGTISKINYHYMHNRRDGSSFPFYDVQCLPSHQVAAEESWIELIERGNVWKYYNKKPLFFTNLKEKADFFELVGQAKSIRNPKNGNYDWTHKEVLEAMRNGQVHRFYDKGLHGCTAIVFNNKSLGRRIAKAVLEKRDGFEVCEEHKYFDINY